MFTYVHWVVDAVWEIQQPVLYHGAFRAWKHGGLQAPRSPSSVHARGES